MAEGARLMAHSKGAQYVSRDDLAQYIPHRQQRHGNLSRIAS